MNKIERIIDITASALLAGVCIPIARLCLKEDNYNERQINTIIKWALKINKEKKQSCHVVEAIQ